MCLLILQLQWLLSYQQRCCFLPKKVTKQIWHQCCHLEAEIGSWFPLIGSHTLTAESLVISQNCELFFDTIKVALHHTCCMGGLSILPMFIVDVFELRSVDCLDFWEGATTVLSLHSNDQERDNNFFINVPSKCTNDEILIVRWS